MSLKETSKRGRPRSAAADYAILRATLDLLIAMGYARMSISEVAKAAGVAKTTIYRRYKNKQELVSAALLSIVLEPSPPGTTGDIHTDLTENLKHGLTFVSAGGASLIGTLLVEERRNPELINFFRKKIFFPRRARIEEILKKGMQRGEVRPDINVEAVIDSLLGPILVRHLDGLPQSEEWIRSFVQRYCEWLRPSATPDSQG